jgi:hypothetical protein
VTFPLTDLSPTEQTRLIRIREIVQEELQAKIASSRKARTKRFRILDLIHYTPPCPSRPKHGDKEDALLLIIVSHRALADMSAFWEEVEDRLSQDRTSAQNVLCLVHTATCLKEYQTDDQSLISRMLQKGISIHSERLSPLKTLPPLGRMPINVGNLVPFTRDQASKPRDHWLNAAQVFFTLGKKCISHDQKLKNVGSFQLNQAAECTYRMYFLTISGYLPATHQLRRMRHLARTLDNRLEEAWQPLSGEDEHYFDLLCRAYIEARYSLTYRTSEAALRWQADRVARLIEIADALCLERLNELGTDGQTPDICQPPQTLV